MCQSSGRNLDHSSGWNAPGSVSTDSRSIFKWPVITIWGQIKMDFGWRFIGWKQTWACCFEPSSLIVCYPLAETNHQKKKVPVELFYKSTKSWRETKGKALSTWIIDSLAKLTRQVRNPGYNLWDKYFIANICLYILRQRGFEVATNERQTESEWTSHQGNGTKDVPEVGGDLHKRQGKKQQTFCWV